MPLYEFLKALASVTSLSYHITTSAIVQTILTLSNVTKNLKKFKLTIKLVKFMIVIIAIFLKRYQTTKIEH